MLRVLLALLLMLGTAAAQPQQPQRMTGEFFLGGTTLVDPPENEPRDSHAYLTVSGAAARRIFDAMRVREVADACQPGRRLRRVGQLQCSVGRAEAECRFAIDLRSGALAAGGPC